MKIKKQMAQGETCVSVATLYLKPALRALHGRSKFFGLSETQMKGMQTKVKARVYEEVNTAGQANNIVCLEDFMSVYISILLLHQETELQQLGEVFIHFDV